MAIKPRKETNWADRGFRVFAGSPALRDLRSRLLSEKLDSDLESAREAEKKRIEEIRAKLNGAVDIRSKVNTPAVKPPREFDPYQRTKRER